jgi:hypothetical protein
MIAPLSKNRVQRFLFLSGIALALYCVAVYWPVSRRADSLSQPLGAALQQLIKASLAEGAQTGVELETIHENLRRTQLRLAAIRQTEQRLLARIGVEPYLRARLKEPFQLIDYLNARQQKIEQLEHLAKQNQVAMKPEVLANLPEYATNESHSTVLWIQLFVTEHVVTTAIQSKIATVESVQLLAVRSHESGAEEQPDLEEVPLKISLIGSMASVSQFLLSLPLRTDEIKGLSLPPAAATKPSLFIDRILLRKQSPEKADEVQLELTATGFVRRDE